MRRASAFDEKCFEQEQHDWETSLKKYTEKAKQRITPLLQNTFRFPLHVHFPCTLVWKILILSSSVCQICARYGDFAYYILLCLYRRDREMQIRARNLVLVWKTSVSESFTVRCFFNITEVHSKQFINEVVGAMKANRKSKLKMNKKNHTDLHSLSVLEMVLSSKQWCVGHCYCFRKYTGNE